MVLLAATLMHCSSDWTERRPVPPLPTRTCMFVREAALTLRQRCIHAGQRVVSSLHLQLNVHSGASRVYLHGLNCLVMIETKGLYVARIPRTHSGPLLAADTANSARRAHQAAHLMLGTRVASAKNTSRHAAVTAHAFRIARRVAKQGPDAL